jgi:hypothetical protein
MNSTKFF